MIIFQNKFIAVALSEAVLSLRDFALHPKVKTWLSKTISPDADIECVLMENQASASIQGKIFIKINDQQPQYIVSSHFIELCEAMQIDYTDSLFRILNKEFLYSAENLIPYFRRLKSSPQAETDQSMVYEEWITHKQKKEKRDIVVTEETALAEMQEFKTKLYQARRHEITISEFSYNPKLKLLELPLMVTREDYAGRGLQRIIQLMLFNVLRPQRINFISPFAGGHKLLVNFMELGIIVKIHKLYSKPHITAGYLNQSKLNEYMTELKIPILR